MEPRKIEKLEMISYLDHLAGYDPGLSSAILVFQTAYKMKLIGLKD